MGLDLFATLGSDDALQILAKEGATALDNYTPQMNTLRVEIGSLGESDLTGRLYGSWLYTEDTLNEIAPAGSPGFMINTPHPALILYASLSSHASRHQA